MPEQHSTTLRRRRRDVKPRSLERQREALPWPLGRKRPGIISHPCANPTLLRRQIWAPSAKGLTVIRQLTDSVTEPLRADLKAFLATRPDLGNPDLAAYTTLADHTVRSFVNGNIPGGNEVVSELRRVLDLAKAGAILQPGVRNGAAVIAGAGAAPVRRARKAPGKFYQTETVQRVAQVLDFCAENAAIGVITADFGCGKTEAVNAWRKANAGEADSLVFEFDQFSSRNIIDFICLLGASFGVDRAGGSANGGTLFRKIFPPVIVVVEESVAKTDKRDGGLCYAGLIADIREKPL